MERFGTVRQVSLENAPAQPIVGDMTRRIVRSPENDVLTNSGRKDINTTPPPPIPSDRRPPPNPGRKGIDFTPPPPAPPLKRP